MSLINDALKRARHAQRKEAPPPAPGLLLRAVEEAPPKSSGTGIWLPLAVAVVVVIGLVVFWAVNLGEADSKVGPVTMQETTGSPAAAETASMPEPPAILPEPKPEPATSVGPEDSPPVGFAPPATTNAMAPASVVTLPATTNAPAAVAEVPPPAIAWPKLQGIFYRPNQPAALLNDKTVLVGSRSGEFLVVAIDRQSVTLAHAGVTNVLRMAE